MASPPVIKPEIAGGVPSRPLVEPNVPVRTSSKRLVDQASLDELVVERNKLSEDVKRLRKKLKPGLSYDAL